MGILTLSVLGIVGAIVAYSLSCRARANRVEVRRMIGEGVTREAFISHFSANNVDPQVANSVFDWFAGDNSDPAVGTEESLSDVYEMGGDDYEDALSVIFRSLRIPDNFTVLESDGPESVRTVGEMVQLVDAVWKRWQALQMQR